MTWGPSHFWRNSQRYSTVDLWKLEHRRLLRVIRTIRSVRFSPDLTDLVEFDRFAPILKQKQSLSRIRPVHRIFSRIDWSSPVLITMQKHYYIFSTGISKCLI
ncbi:hypothetical protein PIB30_075188 [Stylosanthes scabra]|uniref:Uncharacterized protein n=1 Tax=Stylosanthes scabra TaxID=79078 RepID=A0ABU6VQ42_9FABA|nr:hypothetical protein [Stylosanthes scabra]